MSTTASETPASPPQTRSVLGVVFMTLFIDLIGFSIIFPLFPSMLVYYRETEGSSGVFGFFYQALLRLSEIAGPPDHEWGSIVLFGGILGSIYSLLQFLCAPYFGRLSDRVGRKPVLLVSLTGLAISYLLWFFAGNFALLVLSRFIGGIMSANISTATAIVSDVTTPQNRSRGMAVIGIAFGIGFIFGPAIGGPAALLDLTEHFPQLKAFGVNPYSMPAAVAFLLTVFNILSVLLRLPETLPRQEVALERPRRVVNPMVLFRNSGNDGIFRTNWAYFLFLLVFSGMEFSLTFLAVDRLDYTPLQNTYMFIFVGLVLSAMQGGYVRARVHRIGNKRMALQGLLMIAPGMALVGAGGHWQSSTLLYLGLFLLGAGAAQATPCLTALASLYAPQQEQGRVLGVFRSLGALARATGPLVACIMYWRLGSDVAYGLAALFLLVPFAIALRLPEAAAAPDPA